VVFADWQSCSDTFEEILDPVRLQYKAGSGPPWPPATGG
jgi:hypothetical protein